MNLFYSNFFYKKVNKYILIIALFTIIINVPIVCKGQYVTDINKLRSQGLTYLKQNKYVDAMLNFQTALYLGDSSLTTLKMLKTCYTETYNKEDNQKLDLLISKIISSKILQPDWDFSAIVLNDTFYSVNKIDSNNLKNDTNTFLVANLLDSLQKVWLNAQNFILAIKDTSNMNDIETLFNYEKLDVDKFNKLNDTYLQAKSSSLKSDVGLNIGVNYNQNFPIQSPDVDNLVYRRRFSVGLDWNILNNGLLENIIERKVTENERSLSKIEYNRNISVTTYFKIYNRIIYFFNIRKLEILDKREMIFNLKFPIVTELYKLKQIPKITIVKMERQCCNS